MKLLLPFLLFTHIAFSQSGTTKSPSTTKTTSNSIYKGWRDLTWESTEDTIKQKYGSRLTILKAPDKYGGNDELYCPFEIRNYDLAYDTFTVSFIFDLKTKKLKQVNVKKEDPVNARNMIRELEVSLTEKYGKPSVKEESPKYISKWFFSELNIELTHLDIKFGDKQIINTIILAYKKPDKENLDKF